MWVYKCEAGKYTEDSLLNLLFVIFKHRYHHFKNGEGFRD